MNTGILSHNCVNEYTEKKRKKDLLNIPQPQNDESRYVIIQHVFIQHLYKNPDARFTA